MIRPPPSSPLFPSPPLFRSEPAGSARHPLARKVRGRSRVPGTGALPARDPVALEAPVDRDRGDPPALAVGPDKPRRLLDRKSTRLNSSHLVISYAVFCLKKK